MGKVLILLCAACATAPTYTVANLCWVEGEDLYCDVYDTAQSCGAALYDYPAQTAFCEVVDLQQP